MFSKKLADIGEKIKSGELIVMPTDTVYGIACDPFNAAAIEKLYAAKKRPPEKNTSVLVSSIEAAHTFGILSEKCEALVRAHWPGALTVVVKQKVPFPTELSNDGTIAIRVPNHPRAIAIIEACGGVLAVTSANTSGNPPAQNATEAASYFDDTVYIVDDGPSPGGVASTVVNCTTDTFTVLRKGPVQLQ